MIDCPIEKLILERDEEVYSFINNLDEAICLVDDLVDHQVNSVLAIRVAANLNNCMRIASNRPGLYDSVKDNLNLLLLGELEDINFIPLQRSNDEELNLWVKRGYRLSVAFDCLCFIDPEFDTKANRSWIITTQTQGLIRNDCSDITTGNFEDFYQLRRNYVALSCFEQSVYYKWKSHKEELIQKAANIMNSTIFSKPQDERLNSIYTELGSNYGIL